MLLFALLPQAQAFCGTYVGPVGSSLENQAAQVILAREDERTVLTLANDYTGSEANFGIVIPVPEVLDADDVSLPDPELFAAFDLYAAPRIVSYSCEELHGTWDYSTTADTGTASSGGDPANGVVVESSFSAGEYDIVVLSATGSEGLVGWLDANGFSLSASAQPIIQTYIDQGQYFLGAKVNLDSLPPGQSFLSPLQLRYSSASFGLPIRIGTTVSPGEQEVVIHFLTPSSDGKVAISNYSEGSLEDECMMPDSVTDYNEFYEGELESTFDSAIWLTEYAWDLGSCDPCSAEPPTEDQLIAAGATWYGASYDSYITRVKLRYTPSEATQDLVFYTSGLRDSSQVRYIEYNEDLEDSFEVCGVGWTENPGTCDGSEGTGPESEGWPFGGSAGGTSGESGGDKIEDEGGRCSTTPAGGALAPLLGIGVVASRRKRGYNPARPVLPGGQFKTENAS